MGESGDDALRRYGVGGIQIYESVGAGGKHHTDVHETRNCVSGGSKAWEAPVDKMGVPMASELRAVAHSDAGCVALLASVFHGSIPPSSFGRAASWT